VFYADHLSWHLALHELALGRGDEALARLGTSVPLQALSDAGPLLWRCRVAGVPGADTHPAAPVIARSTLPVLRGLPLPFAAFNAALALAAAGDADALDDLASRAAADPRPGFDLLAPIARGLALLVLGEPAAAAARIRPVLADLPRIGGSYAQREVIDQTLALAEAA
jgi:hypothetical protein